MIGLLYGEKTDDMLSRIHLILERNVQTDGQTDIFSISILCISILMCDKNYQNTMWFDKLIAKIEGCNFLLHSVLSITGNKWHVLFLLTSHPSMTPTVSASGVQVKCMDIRLGELVELREIAVEQMTNKLAAVRGNCDVVKDSHSDPQTTSMAAAAVCCGMPNRSPSVG